MLEIFIYFSSLFFAFLFLWIFIIIADIIKIVIVLFCTLLAIEHIIIHVVSFRLEVTTKGYLRFAAALHKKLDLLRAVDVQIETSSLRFLGEDCYSDFLILTCFGKHSDFTLFFGF